MNKYQSFRAVDFIADDYFLNWVLEPDPEINSFWENWLANNPQQAQEVEKAVRIIKSIEFGEETHLNSFQKARLLEKINSRIDNLESSKKEKFFSSKKMRDNLRYAGSIAAGLAIMFFLGYYFFNGDYETSVQTDFAEKREVVLPDGSLVLINSNSKISYASSWEDKKLREVWLEGEAFFEVVETLDKNEQPKAFKVHSAHLDIEVLGTSFNVGDRRGQTQVTLFTGKVKLENKLDENAPPLFLEPGEHAEVSKEDRVIKKSKVDTRKYAGWVNNKLIFEQARLKEIKHVLEDNFGLEVIFEDKEMLNRRFTGVIKTDNIDEFLRTLELSFDVNVTKKEGKIIFHK